MKHTVVGTAGHIDHGKTALLKALTGIDADRLPEEKKRGMTIDLGFVIFDKNVTFIDVPGHEKFIKNMLAGVSTIDMVLLVIAADDGIMPQTREHFDIVRMLNIHNGIIVLTKIDLADEEWLTLIEEEIRTFVGGTFLEQAPILQVSNITLQGIPELRETLLRIITDTPAKRDTGVFRLWIDRVFSFKGVGTIVTGTVLSGSLRTGDRIELFPQRTVCHVRKIQVHNEEVEICRIGERAGLNLTGVETPELERGQMLAEPGYYEPTYIINVRLQLLKNIQKPLRNRTRLRFHVGTVEILCRIYMLDKQPLQPGQSALVQIRLEAQAAVEPDDYFIVRSYSPAVTIGGGNIVEVHPDKLRYLPESGLQTLEALDVQSPEQLVVHAMNKQPLNVSNIDTLKSALSIQENVLQDVLTELAISKVITLITKAPAAGVVLTQHIEEAREELKQYLQAYHNKYPLKEGVKQSELRQTLFPSIDLLVFNAILEPMVLQKTVKIRNEVISLFNHTISFEDRDLSVKEEIENIYCDAHYTTPSIAEIIEQFPRSKPAEIQAVIQGMIESNILIIIKYEKRTILFHRQHVDKARELLIDFLQKNKEITMSQFRELLGSTRKYALPLLIYFDSIGITERSGDVRRLK